MKSIVVIGSGLSGLVLVSSLLEKENEASSILLIEKNPEQLGKGIAYKSEFELQPLNVRAGRMSIYQHHP
ncbi:MAG TPA: FAD/NAD(P)-binding protein, partial [Flavobacteriales bacterium]|nr:FAD/NAD(P)-binding protein [Flavobacteriales bacterium]